MQNNGRLRAEINLSVIRSNWATLQQLSGHAMASAVVKADAYGHGMAAVAKTLSQAGCSMFFTASIEEAAALRAILPDADIAYFDGLASQDMEAVLTHRIMPSVGDGTQLQYLETLAAQKGEPVPALLNIDTGMNRLGTAPAFVHDMIDHDGFHAGDWRMVYSHLACADDPGHPMNQKQREQFKASVAHPALASIPKSLAATGGIVLGGDYHFDVTRPGLGLYGLTPNGDPIKGLQPALSLKARVLQIRHAESGETVGYGASHPLSRKSRLATIAGGYADGINRKLSGQGQVRVADLTAPMIGRVSMDVHVIDITDWPAHALAVGDWVTLVGDGLSVHDWAKNCDTIAYEMLTTLGLRAKRHYAD